MEVLHPRGYGYHRTTVTHRKHSSGGEPIGRSTTNPIIYTILYKAVLSGEELLEVSTHQVVESILISCDADGNELILSKTY